MAEIKLRFSVPRGVESLEFADMPQSDELAEALELLHISRLGDLTFVSLQDIGRVCRAADAVVLEMGCLVRRAVRGEFGSPGAEADRQDKRERLWGTRPGEAPGERIEIPEAFDRLPLEFCQMPRRLRNGLHRLGLTRVGDFRGKKYQHFLREHAIGVKTLQDLRELVQRIREGRAEAPAAASPEAAPCFVVPEAVRAVVPYSFPISVRLDGVKQQ